MPRNVLFGRGSDNMIACLATSYSGGVWKKLHAEQVLFGRGLDNIMIACQATSYTGGVLENIA